MQSWDIPMMGRIKPGGCCTRCGAEACLDKTERRTARRAGEIFELGPDGVAPRVLIMRLQMVMMQVLMSAYNKRRCPRHQRVVRYKNMTKPLCTHRPRHMEEDECYKTVERIGQRCAQHKDAPQLSTPASYIRYNPSEQHEVGGDSEYGTAL